jgi:hypothetical protein
MSSRLFVSSDVSINGRLYVGNDLTTNARLYVTGDVSFGSRLFINGDVSMNSRLFVTNDVSIGARLFVGNDVTINGRLNVLQYNSNNIIYTNVTSSNYTLVIAEDISVNGRLNVNYDVSLNSRLFVGSDVSMGGNLFIGGGRGLDISNNLMVYGIINQISGSLVGSSTSGIVSSDTFVSGNLNTYGNTLLYGDVSVNSRLFVVSDVSFNGNMYSFGQTIIQGDLSVNSRLFVGNDVSLNGNLFVNSNIYTNSNVIANGVTLTSDYRIKDNIVPLDATYTVDNLRPVQYYNKNSKKEDIGVIAHELQEQYPSLVTGLKDGEYLQTVNYIGLIPVLINELQNIKKFNVSLQNQVKSMQLEIDELKNVVINK